jgi:hypothetical protein
MAAMAGVFRQAAPLSYDMESMSKDDAKISYLFVKNILTSIFRLPGIEEQRMPTNFADKLTVTIALTHFGIVMTKKEAGEGMSDARYRAVFLKKVCLA